VPDAPPPALRANVPLLGLTALLNDAASEAAYWVLPYFLTTIGAGPAALGIIEGAAESAASLVKLASGYVTDRLPRRKPLVVAGYLLANVVKPLLALATSWQQVLAIRVTDRSGKGLRGAPRDVMITESADPARLGAAFGLRQAMDSAGAIIGPAFAAWLLLRHHQSPRVVFWAASVPGAMAVLTVWLGVKETADPGRSQRRAAQASSGAAFSLRLRLVFVAVALFGIANSSDMFLVLRAQGVGIRPALAPLLGLVFNVTYTALAYPLGNLSDRWPRQWMIAGGYMFYAIVYLGFAQVRTPAMIWVLFAGYGIYYALTEGLLRALIADLAGPTNRGRAFGWLAAMSGGSALVASILAGQLWHFYGASVPFELSAGLAAAAAVMLAVVGGKRVEREY